MHQPRSGDAPDPEAFKAGLARARRGGPLLHDLFSARTLGLFDLVPAAGLNSYLSGLLIGSYAPAPWLLRLFRARAARENRRGQNAAP